MPVATWLAAAGGSVSDLLENIPSVEVTTDGEISLRGSTSVEVWINGKQSGLTSDNRGDILQQIPAESIERIEIIDNPSAKYSPEGTAGIIIVLKRDRRAGYYGSVQTGANGSLDLGLRKTFMNKTFALALNWRDVFNTRKFENFTEGPTFWRHQKNHRAPRINLQLTWNFGNMAQKKRSDRDDQQGGDQQGGDDAGNFGGYE